VSQRASQLRVIGGQWRSRKLVFPALAGLRPTPDRVRETLFNWLSPRIHGAHCLDLFAGSGALGIEALSRGAAHVVFVDNDAQATKTLRENLQALQTHTADVLTADASRWLKQAPPHTFDLVFLDPPFSQELLTPVCQALNNSTLLNPNALIYLESERNASLLLPAGWTVLKDKTTGQVRYQLVEKNGG
jgi:16S rRNA (guanine966-N2)-methyltransferase